MKQKIITALLGIGVMGFLSKDKISEFINNKTAINQSTIILDTISTSEYVDTILEKSMKNITSIGEKNAKRIGFVNHGILSKIGGRTKSLALGGTKPSPSALENDPSTRTPIYCYSSGCNGATLWAKASVCEIQRM
jgi:hypothetical protein